MNLRLNRIERMLIGRPGDWCDRNQGKVLLIVLAIMLGAGAV